MLQAKYRQIEVALVFEELEQAVGLIERGIDAHAEIMEVLLSEDIGADSEGAFEGWDLEAQQNYRRVMYGQTLYRALFISSWSHLEQLLRQISTDLKEDLRLSLSERELSGSGVTRSMLYLRKVALLDLDLGAIGWQRISAYSELRNHFVHRGTNADDAPGPAAARTEFARLPDLRIEPAGEIILQSGFLLAAVSSMHRLLLAVLAAASDRDRR